MKNFLEIINIINVCGLDNTIFQGQFKFWQHSQILGLQNPLICTTLAPQSGEKSNLLTYC